MQVVTDIRATPLPFPPPVEEILCALGISDPVQQPLSTFIDDLKVKNEVIAFRL